jgi:hypothetical protein
MSDDGEVLLRVWANHWRGIEAVGGRLTVTSTLLSFRAHSLNIQTDPLDLPLRDIVSIAKYRSAGIVPNGLVVRTASGEEYRFVVWKRDRIIALIEAHRG